MELLDHSVGAPGLPGFCTGDLARGAVSFTKSQLRAYTGCSFRPLLTAVPAVLSRRASAGRSYQAALAQPETPTRSASCGPIPISSHVQTTKIIIWTPPAQRLPAFPPSDPAPVELGRTGSGPTPAVGRGHQRLTSRVRAQSSGRRRRQARPRALGPSALA